MHEWHNTILRQKLRGDRPIFIKIRVQKAKPVDRQASTTVFFI